MINSLINFKEKKFSLNQFTKNALMNEIRNSGNIKSSEVPRYCDILSRFIYILYHGEKLNETETYDTFFSITKLFKFSDPIFRRLCYLAVRELKPDPSSAIAIYNFVIKDMADKNPGVSSSAFRVVYSIFEKDLFLSANMLRSFKQSIDNYSSLKTCHALVVLNELLSLFPDVAKTVQSSIRQIYRNSNDKVMQYNAAVLLHRINMKDGGTILQNILDNKSALHHTVCYNIRVALKQLKQSLYTEKNRELYLFISKNVFNKKKIVVLDSTAALVEFFEHKSSSSLNEDIKAKDIKQVISALFSHLSDCEAAVKFMSLKTLNRAIELQNEISSKNMEVLQGLLNDPNRCVVTLAINVLLKVCPESNVDKLMTKMSGMMHDIPDQFRTIVIDSIKNVARKFVKTQKSLMKFLTQMFRSNSGFKCKMAIVNTIREMMHENPSSREAGLLYLCEFIEDCDHSSITCRILHLLSQEAPNTPNPFRFVRFIYNRITLDITKVRAAALSTLARIGMACADLSQTIITILGRLMTDMNDEIRDRAVLFHRLLQCGCPPNSISLNYKLEPLRLALIKYTSDSSLLAEKFNPERFISAVHSHEESDKTVTQEMSHSSNIHEEHLKSSYEGIGDVVSISCNVASLSDQDSDLVVKCYTFMYSEYIALLFDVENTMTDCDICDVFVEISPLHSTSYRVIKQAKADRIDGNSKGLTSILLSGASDNYDSAEFKCCLRFGIFDEQVGGSPERYELEKVSISFSDFVCPLVINESFKTEWESLGEENECVEVISLSGPRSIKEGVDMLMGFYGLYGFEGTEKVENQMKMSHTLMMGGCVKGVNLLVIAKLLVESGDDGDHVLVELSVRCEDSEIGDIFINLLYS